MKCKLTRTLSGVLTILCAFALFGALACDAREDEDETRYEFGYPNDPPIDPVPIDNYALRSLFTIDFTDPSTTLDGWEARDGVKLERGERSLRIISQTHDPYFFSPMIPDLLKKYDAPQNHTTRGKLFVKLRVRRENTGMGQIFIAQEDSPSYSEGYSTIYSLEKDDAYHDYSIAVDSDSPILRIRFDIGGDEGLAEIERIELVQVIAKPIKFGVYSLKDGTALFNLVNTGEESRIVEMKNYGFDVRKTYPTSVYEVTTDGAQVDRYYPQKRPFEEMEVVATTRETNETVSRRFFAFNEEAADRALEREVPTIKSDSLQVRFAVDGSGAEIFRNGKRVAVIAPLLCEEGDGSNIIPPIETKPEDISGAKPAAETRLTPVFRSISDDSKEIAFDVCAIPVEEFRKKLDEVAANSVAYDPLKLEGNKPTDLLFNVDPGMVVGSMKFRIDGDLLAFDYDAPRPVHAPVARPLGEMLQAVFPGVEYLEKGEHSSSTADIDTKETIRYAPPLHWITQPFASIVTDRGSVSVLYDDPRARAIFAVPDFLDGDETSSRFNICAPSGSGKIRVADVEPLENAILWFVQTYGLPDVPVEPYDFDELERVILYGLEESALLTPEGWVHALAQAGPPYAFKPSHGSDFISTIWEISGSLPDVPRVDYGGGHIRNYVSLFLTGNAKMLANYWKASRRGIISSQRDDGSFRYYGKFLQGHWCDYASGDCGNRLFTLMEDWRLTGNKDALACAEKGLAFANRLKTPAGAQVWELSLHTPDIMGSSRCVLANVLAYRATGKEEYLEAARRWALTGVPFVYLWEDRDLANGKQPMMKYATIAVFGATGWKSPNWMGRPVQWCGLDYAYALILLSEYDKTVDWRKIADGIVASAECQLYVDEPEFKGLLPDSVQVSTQERYVYNINPTAVHMLRKMLRGEQTNVSVADVAGRRVVAPYPIRVDGNDAIISAKKGTVYDVMIDGEEIRKIESVGEDVLHF